LKLKIEDDDLLPLNLQSIFNLQSAIFNLKGRYA